MRKAEIRSGNQAHSIEQRSWGSGRRYAGKDDTVTASSVEHSASRSNAYLPERCFVLGPRGCPPRLHFGRSLLSRQFITVSEAALHRAFLAETREGLRKRCAVEFQAFAQLHLSFASRVVWPNEANELVVSEKSLIKSWNGKAATFVEDARDGTVMVTVEDDRCEMSKVEWEQLPANEGKSPENFNNPASS